MAVSSRTHDRTRYQGKNLIRLLLAIGLPAVVLYLRVVFAIAASAHHVTSREYIWLLRSSDVAVWLFLVVQLVAARYLQSFFKPARTKSAAALQYAGVVVFCVFCSISLEIVLEAIGYNFFLRVLGRTP